MPRKKTQEEFIKEFIDKWGGGYDLSRLVYIHANKKIEIGCPKHGWVERRANDVLRQKAPCPKCGWDIGGKNGRLSQSEFISHSNKVHNWKYDYSLVEYVLNNVSVKIICPDHGLFEQKPNHHLNGRGCSKCGDIIKGNSKRTSLEKFLDECYKVHNDFYDYSLVEYVNTNSKVKIICPIHGLFEQTPHSHLSGKGCRRCGNERKKDNPGGYHNIYRDNPEILKTITPSYFYIVRLFDEKENFIKGGITKNPYERFKNIRSKSGYSLEEIDIIEYPSMYEAVIHELEFQEAQQRYYPVRKFSGYTECYKIS
jgi:hypothetical protein